MNRHQTGSHPHTKVVELNEFFENVATGPAAAHVVVGPRTQGCSDTLWDSEVELLRRRTDLAETVTDNQNIVSPLMVAIASHLDPTMQFKPGCESRVHGWFVGDFKRAYQGARVPGKRPWPEFAASLRTGIGFVDSDFAVVSLVTSVSVATLEEGHGLVIAPLLLDAPYNTLVLDARSCQRVPLGALCDEATRTLGEHQGAIGAGAGLRDTARALAMEKTNVPKKVLASKVSSRAAALQTYVTESADASSELTVTSDVWQSI
jgi:hypothetical protein